MVSTLQPQIPAITKRESLLHAASWYAATTLRERALLVSAAGKLGPRIDPDLAARHRALWRTQAPFNARSYFSERLASDGLTEAGFLRAVGQPDAAIRDGFGSPPSWLISVAQAFSLQSSGEPSQHPDAGTGRKLAGLLGVIAPLIEKGRERLNAGLGALHSVHPEAPFDPAITSDMLCQDLHAELLRIITKTLVLELHVARLEERLSGLTTEQRFQSFLSYISEPGTALEILQQYPVLTRQVVTCIDHWLAFSLEFVGHLCADWQPICAELAAGTHPGRLTGLSGGAGDSHREGRSVRIATFGSGFQLVYKPRAMSLDRHFQQLLEWLNRRGASPAFRLLKVLDCGNHGWSEFIAHRTCSSDDDVHRFYERLGGLLALLYALEATDFHGENLIAVAEHPMLVDLEALFHPRVDGRDISEADQLAANTLNYSVLRVGLLPHRGSSADDTQWADFSGLGSLAGQLSPRAIPTLENPGTDEMKVVRKRLPMSGSSNQPTLDGEHVNVLDFDESLTTGFTRIYHLLMTHREELRGPLASFANDEVRVLVRSTRNYAAILSESLHPDRLRDGLDRDRLFDRLWAGIEHRPHLASLIPFERDDLQNGDIPMFTTRPCSRDLWSSHGERLPGFFDETGMNLVERRIRQLSGHDLAQQLWLIQASLATLTARGNEPRGRAYDLIPTTETIESSRLLSMACSVGDRLVALALHGEHDVSWVGLALNEKEEWCLTPLETDLYAGLPGVILFLAYLGSITGSQRYKRLAETALVTLRHQLERRRSYIASVGAFDGWGGILYLLTHLSSLWSDADLTAEAEALIDALRPLIRQDARFDVVGGAAGCLVVLLGLHECTASPSALAAAVECGEWLIAHAEPVGGAAGWVNPNFGPKPLTGFSHGASGIAWALMQLSAVTGGKRFRAMALRALDYEHTLYSAEARNWPDLRVVANRQGESELPFPSAWCHGAPGIGLARLHLLGISDDPRLRSDFDNALRTTMAQGFGDNHSLCHGDLGNLELLLQASEKLDDPELGPRLRRMTAMVVESITRSGWFCGTSLRVESPGLMTGLAGIGYGMLRLANPGRVPSILTLEPPPRPIVAPAPFKFNA